MGSSCNNWALLITAAGIIFHKRSSIFRAIYEPPKNEVNILKNRCESGIISPVISYGDSEALKVNIQIDNKDIILLSEISLEKKPVSNEKRNFVMVLLKSIPSEDWSIYFDQNYIFSFDAKSSKHIVAIQIEIKNSKSEKIMDCYVKTTSEYQTHYYEIKNS